MSGHSRDKLGMLAFVLAMAVMLLLPLTALAAPTIIEDAEFTYSGTWHTFSDPNMSGGSNHYASYAESPGAYGEYTFSGTDVTFISTIGNNRGDVAIYLDGVFQTNVSEYSPAVLYQQRLWSKHGLTLGNHTIRIVCLGTGAGTPTNYAEIDAIEVDTIPVVSTSATSWWSLSLLAVAATGLVWVIRRRTAI